MRIEIRQQEFVLLHQKAVYWVARKTLLIADLHLGKISHFRKEGIALPREAIKTNFVRIDEMMAAYQVERIIFLGDLFHSSYNTEWELFAAWRRSHSHIEMLIVLGNHDILPRWLFWESNIKVFVEDYTEDSFVFTHHPAEAVRDDRFVFAAHIHPFFLLRGRGRQALRLACFMLQQQQMVLPGFGVFTGGHEINNEVYEQVFVVSGNHVLRV